MSCNNQNNVLGSNRLSSRVDNFVLNHSSAPVDFPGTTDLLESVTQPEDQTGLDSASYTDKKILELASDFDGKYVTLTFANTTYASQDIVYGKSALNIDVNGYTVGYEVFNGTGGDYIKFKTSTFMLVDPSSGTETTPFYYDSGKFKFSGDVLIDGNLVVTGSINGNKLENNTVGNGQMATNSINARTIVAGSITASLIAANTITANEIASNYVYAGTISANQIYAGTAGSSGGNLCTMYMNDIKYYGIKVEGSAVYGIYAKGTGTGVTGTSASGTGIAGSSSGGGNGVSGTSTSGYGGYFRSDNTWAVYSDGPLVANGQIKATGAVTSNYYMQASGNIETTGTGNGFLLKSPNGTRWKITVDNSGNLSAVQY